MIDSITMAAAAMAVMGLTAGAQLTWPMAFWAEFYRLRHLGAIRATGASRMQVLVWGVWPQITPAFAGVSVFRWDINIREATVLGLVGAGGIGMNLESSMSTLAWNQVTLILLVILGTVVISEYVSARVRQAVS